MLLALNVPMEVSDMSVVLAQNCGFEPRNANMHESKGQVILKTNPAVLTWIAWHCAV